jgi:hypothetical protein
VDVIVSDNKGQFVPGLKTEDFTVKEDGKAQRISGFNLHRYEAPRALPALQLPPNQYTNFSQQEPGGAVTILMLDTLNTPRPGTSLCSQGDGGVSQTPASWTESGFIHLERPPAVSSRVHKLFRRADRGGQVFDSRTIAVDTDELSSSSVS